MLASAAEHIRSRMAQSPGLATLADQIEFTVTSEGLKIDLVERADSSFFDSGSAELRGESERILQIIAGELSPLENEVVLEGHTDRRPYADGTRYGNWELSADRANAARRVIERAGLKASRVRGVRGYADTQLRLAERPFDPRNRRVSIVVRSHAAAALDAAVKASQTASAAAPSSGPPPAAPETSPPSGTPPTHE